jgi:2-dehydro-3-deoxyphosphogluconate aldolase/(4S)-4-hydroxy-2-oxoglutarate aldolase
MDVIEVLQRTRVVPVAVIDDANRALALAQALSEGGIDVIEVTLRTAAGLDAITALSPLSTTCVGAGTVITPEQVDAAVAAGAEFIVSPGLSVPVVQRAQELGVPILPGVATPSELLAAIALGLKVVKFFPAGVLGGPAAIRALAAPFTELKFVPTGGINAANLADYLALPCVLAAGASWMVERRLIADDRWSEITDRAAQAVRLAKEA